MPWKIGPSDSRHAAASSGRGKGRVPAGSSLQSSCFAGLSTEKLPWKAKSKDKWRRRSPSTEFFLSHYARDVDLLLGPMLCNSSSWKGVVVKLSKLLCCLDFFLLFSLGQKRERSSVTAAGEREETDLAWRKECVLLYLGRGAAGGVCMEQLLEKGRISVPTSPADTKGQNFGSAVCLVSCCIGDKGTGTVGVELKDETLLWCGSTVWNGFSGHSWVQERWSVGGLKICTVLKWSFHSQPKDTQCSLGFVWTFWNKN